LNPLSVQIKTYPQGLDSALLLGRITDSVH